ncbi:uncharacterized protein EDB91DRAFT_224783 [Suillus paluster]|uniref:uncharacterized protein n=1 Tax=Suillus paluster TaxID=48578 RepID=UPI001B875201|nr:uncharacterized protein EDB91DRAFT_224783 [Suillus paluster]KAG1743737.1 hypothetical protein EDB91DRAFT_224783 [Suillus paluster]
MDRTDFSEQSSLQSDGNKTSGALRSFFSFPFSSDEVYQQGLADLHAHDALSGRTEGEKAEVILRTQLFYFNRVTGQDVTAEDVRFHRDTANSQNFTENMDISRPSSKYQDGETHLLTFAELTSLIEQGKTDSIPNNKVIPDTLNDAPPSTSIAPMRKKPWEVDDQF